MRDRSYRPAFAFTALCFSLATAANFFTVNWWKNPIGYAMGSLILAGPFAVLLLGQARFARTWRRNAFLVLGNVIFAFLWFIASFAMRWFQPGLPGIMFFGGVLSMLSLGYASLSRCIKEPQ
jgi:hypothetical protein